MKKYLLLLVPLATLAACSPPTDYPELARTEGNGRVDVYYGAAGFNAKDTAAWHRIHCIAFITPRPEHQVLTVHFLDTAAYQAPAGGMYGRPQDIRQVIAQYVVTADGKELFADDPGGTGRYTEPAK